jgi:hypothetical protein
VKCIVALFDACVFYPAPLCDLALTMSGTGLFRARWTDDIHDEWLRNLTKNRPELDKNRLAERRRRMDQSVLDCLVTGYHDLIPALTLPDPDDRHVLAAAIRCGATVIVTSNLKDFPVDTLKQYDIEPQHPDDFFNCIFDLSPSRFCAAAKEQRSRLKNPCLSVESFLRNLENQGLPQTVAQLREFESLL